MQVSHSYLDISDLEIKYCCSVSRSREDPVMEACEAAPDVLLQRPWLPVNIGGCQLLAKSCFGASSYHLLLTDTHCVWQERAGTADIQRRAQVWSFCWNQIKRSVFAEYLLFVFRSSTNVCGRLWKPSSTTCVRWYGPVCQEVTVGLMAAPWFPWYGRIMVTSE